MFVGINDFAIKSDFISRGIGMHLPEPPSSKRLADPEINIRKALPNLFVWSDF